MGKIETIQESRLSFSFEELIKQAYNCLECGKCTGGCPMARLFPEHFNPHHILKKLLIDPENAVSDPGIWFCASCYVCNRLCPQPIELPDIFLKLRKMAINKYGYEKLTKALEIINKKVPFLASFFWVCLHPERIPIDRSVINDLINKSLVHDKPVSVTSKQKKVAVIGAGPAGLLAAYELSQKGYSVTIFESQPYAGGMLRKCIPEYRLPTEVIEKDIKNIKEKGVEIKINTGIGKDLKFNELHNDDYQAIFIASGAHRCTALGIEGEDLSGVVFTLDFLEELKNKGTKKVGQKVVVIGGGNTAMDVASTAARLGAEEVMLIYRRTRGEMPADRNEIREAEDEGVKIQYLTGPVRFIGENRVTSIECNKMKLGEPDFTGRRRPIPIENSNFIIETDQVIIATGEKPTINFLPEDIDLNNNGSIAINPLTMETSFPGVFAGGDVTLGSATVSEAILAAKKAVIGIDNYLESK